MSLYTERCISQGLYLNHMLPHFHCFFVLAHNTIMHNLCIAYDLTPNEPSVYFVSQAFIRHLIYVYICRHTFLRSKPSSAAIRLEPTQESGERTRCLREPWPSAPETDTQDWNSRTPQGLIDVRERAGRSFVCVGLVAVWFVLLHKSFGVKKRRLPAPRKPATRCCCVRQRGPILRHKITILLSKAGLRHVG